MHGDEPLPAWLAGLQAVEVDLVGAEPVEHCGDGGEFLTCQRRVHQGPG